MCNYCCDCNVFFDLNSKINSILLRGVQATVTSGRKLLNNGQILAFNNLVSNQTSFLSLDITTGVFTTSKAGNYFVSFYVNIDGTDANTEVSFSVNGIPSQAVSAVQGQMSGFALLSLNVGDTISITNTSNQEVVISGTDIQACITIVTN